MTSEWEEGVKPSSHSENYQLLRVELRNKYLRIYCLLYQAGRTASLKLVAKGESTNGCNEDNNGMVFPKGIFMGILPLCIIFAIGPLGSRMDALRPL